MSDQGNKSDLSDSPITIREIRRKYKITLAEESVVRESKGSTNKPDCLRCLLIQQGANIISCNIIYSCAIGLPDARVSEEPSSSLSLIDETNSSYRITLSVSCALWGGKPRFPSWENIGPYHLVKQRALIGKKEKKPLTKHMCDAYCIEISKEEDVNMVSSTSKPRHVIIYTPPCFGKTQTQHYFAKRGVFVLDTDDCPGVCLQDLVENLSMTSILTNQLEIMLQLPDNINAFALIPSNIEVLKKRSSSSMLSDSDYEYWYCLHQELLSKPNIKIGLVKNQYLLDWFEPSKRKGF